MTYLWRLISFFPTIYGFPVYIFSNFYFYLTWFHFSIHQLLYFLFITPYPLQYSIHHLHKNNERLFFEKLCMFLYLCFCEVFYSIQLITVSRTFFETILNGGGSLGKRGRKSVCHFFFFSAILSLNVSRSNSSS
jgi:hypothetical protein